jgi:hypothetical protein
MIPGSVSSLIPAGCAVGAPYLRRINFVEVGRVMSRHGAARGEAGARPDLAALARGARIKAPAMQSGHEGYSDEDETGPSIISLFAGFRIFSFLSVFGEATARRHGLIAG